MNIQSTHTDRLTRRKQSARFIFAGGFNVFLTFGIFWLLVDYFRLYYVAASVLTWIVGITVNFSFMWFWVFKEDDLKDGLGTYQRHFVFHVIYYLVNLTLLVFFTEISGAHPLAVQAVLLIFLVPINFLGTKYLVMNIGPLKRFLAR